MISQDEKNTYKHLTIEEHIRGATWHLTTNKKGPHGILSRGLWPLVALMIGGSAL